MKTKTKPKIKLILKKNGKKQYLYPSARKTKYFLNNKAKFYLKQGYLITISVSYGKRENVFGKLVEFENSGTYSKLVDLKWALQTFYYEYEND